MLKKYTGIGIGLLVTALAACGGGSSAGPGDADGGAGKGGSAGGTAGAPGGRGGSMGDAGAPGGRGGSAGGDGGTGGRGGTMGDAGAPGGRGGTGGQPSADCPPPNDGTIYPGGACSGGSNCSGNNIVCSCINGSWKQCRIPSCPSSTISDPYACQSGVQLPALCACSLLPPMTQGIPYCVCNQQ
jgi:hypothetical protein